MGKKKNNTTVILGVVSVLVILICIFIGVYNSNNKVAITGVKSTYKYNADDIHIKGKTKPNTTIKLVADDGETYDKTKSDSDGHFKITVEDLDSETAGKYYLKVTSGNKTVKKNFKVVNGSVGKSYLSVSEDDDYDSDYSDDDDTDSVTSSSESETFNAADYQTDITYDQLARTPDDYKQKKIVLTGTVIQVIEDDGMTEMRLAVNGDYDTIVLVDILDADRGSSHVLEDDNITVYGISTGTTTYESTMGGNITIPSMVAKKLQY